MKCTPVILKVKNFTSEALRVEFHLRIIVKKRVSTLLIQIEYSENDMRLNGLVLLNTQT